MTAAVNRVPDPTDPDGDPHADNPRDRIPRVSAGARQFLAEAETLEEALFDLANIFRVPVTNNIPWFENNNPALPIYHVGDFIDEVRSCFLRAGWTPPTAAPAEDAS